MQFPAEAYKPFPAALTEAAPTWPLRRAALKSDDGPPTAAFHFHEKRLL